jgi:hypothetical protein
MKIIPSHCEEACDQHRMCALTIETPGLSHAVSGKLPVN